MICNFYSVCIYAHKCFCLHRVIFVFISSCISVLFSLFLYFFIKKNSVNFIYLLTYFDCFGSVGKLEFRVSVVKISEATFFGRYDMTSDFPFQEIPSGSDNENSEATLQNTIYLGFL